MEQMRQGSLGDRNCFNSILELPRLRKAPHSRGSSSRTQSGVACLRWLMKRRPMASITERDFSAGIALASP